MNPDMEHHIDYSRAVEEGLEFMRPGRRNFLSPIVQYKATKSKFYKNEAGNTLPQTDVPLEKWEVDMICEGTNYNSSIIWNSMPQNDPFMKGRKKRRSFEELEESCSKEVIEPEQVESEYRSPNYTDSIFNYAVADVFEDYDFNDDDINLKNLIDSELQLIDTLEDNSFQKAELLEEVCKLDTIMVNEDNHLYKDDRGKVFSEYYHIIVKHMERHEIYQKENGTTKDFIKTHIKFLKTINNRKINQFKKFDYSKLEDATTGFDRKNIYDAIDYLANKILDGKMDASGLKEFERNTFPFLHNKYIVKRRQKVALIPSGGGKTTLFSKYYKYVMDIDYLRTLNNDEEWFFFIATYSKTFERWDVINKYWKLILWKFQNLYKNRILLCHSIHQLPFFSLGLELCAYIPLKKEDYDVRFYKQNVKSIENETSNVIRDHHNNMFFNLYKFFFLGSFGDTEHYQIFEETKIIRNKQTKNEKDSILYSYSFYVE